MNVHNVYIESEMMEFVSMSKNKGKRHIKTQSSNKISGFCPAGLKVVFENYGNTLLVFLKCMWTIKIYF